MASKVIICIRSGRKLIILYPTDAFSFFSFDWKLILDSATSLVFECGTRVVELHKCTMMERKVEITWLQSIIIIRSQSCSLLLRSEKLDPLRIWMLNKSWLSERIGDDIWRTRINCAHDFFFFLNHHSVHLLTRKTNKTNLCTFNAQVKCSPIRAMHMDSMQSPNNDIWFQYTFVQCTINVRLMPYADCAAVLWREYSSRLGFSLLSYILLVNVRLSGSTVCSKREIRFVFNLCPGPHVADQFAILECVSKKNAFAQVQLHSSNEEYRVRARAFIHIFF